MGGPLLGPAAQVVLPLHGHLTDGRPCVQLLEPGVASLHRRGSFCPPWGSPGVCWPLHSNLFENFSSRCRVDAFASEIPQRPEEELWTRVSLVFPLVISGVFDSPLAWRVCGWWSIRRGLASVGGGGVSGECHPALH